jgi:hypothetical protein
MVGKEADIEALKAGDMIHVPCANSDSHAAELHEVLEELQMTCL